MSEQNLEDIHFFISEQGICNYLPNLNETMVVTPLLGKHAKTQTQLLSEYGFRRSLKFLYRPICINCSACKPVRVITSQFSPSKSQRRIINRNKDIEISTVPAVATEPQYDLFKRYLKTRHDDGNMANMSFEDYQNFIENSPIDTRIIEYRLLNNAGTHKQLIAVTLCDIFEDGISMVYSFFDPELKARSLGKFMILEHIKTVKDRNLDYLYLGYWVNGSKKMDYKIEYKPLEYVAMNNGWQPLVIKEG